MEMAFPVPEHLPRSATKTKELDISTKILTALAEETPLTLGSTSKWVQELSDAISETKTAIRTRIDKDKDAFDKQFETAKSIQRRLDLLSGNVDELQRDLEDSQTGVLPNIIKALREHHVLAQESLEAKVTSSSLKHLDKCKKVYNHLTVLLKEGRLPEAVISLSELRTLLASAPPPLDKSAVLLDLQNLASRSNDRVLEQLQRALAECVSIKDDRITIRSQYGEHMSLHDIFTSIPPEVLVEDLVSLRKDIFSRFIDRILQGHSVIVIEETSVHIRSSDSPDYFTSLLVLFTYLRSELLPNLPVPHRGDFAGSFYFPLADAFQSRILIPSIPNSISQLPTYLGLVRAAVDLESQLVKAGFFLGVEHRLRAWSDGVQIHYEKKRRAELLDKARMIILTDEKAPVRIEVNIDFHTTDEADEKKNEEASWGFDDEEPKTSSDEHHEKKEEEADGGGDGWGFDDEEASREEAPEEEDAWGTEWDVPVEDPDSPKAIKQPKEAKGDKTPKSAKSQETYLVSHAAISVATLAKEILEEGLDLMRSQFFSNFHFPSNHSTLLLSTTPSTFDLFLALYTVARTDDIQQALSNKIRFSNDCKYLADTVSDLQRHTEEQADLRTKEPEALRRHFEETKERLEVISKTWLEDILEEGTEALLNELAGADRLINLQYDEPYSEAQSHIKKVKNRLTMFPTYLKEVLTPTACYTSLGAMVDRILEQMLQDIFAMKDISEIQSERIATLFRVMHPLDTLFPELENGVSTVASYVPSWLKFLYLSDIMEGSLADIISWYDAGHLVDYEPEELAQLITALFAESPQRSNAIARVLSS